MPSSVLARLSPAVALGADLDPDGHWVTVSGQHIHITGEGTIDAGGHPSLREVLADRAGLVPAAPAPAAPAPAKGATTAKGGLDLSAVRGIDQNKLFRAWGDEPRPSADYFDLPDPVRLAVIGWTGGLGKAEKKALAAYTDHQYEAINTPLRQDPSLAGLTDGQRKRVAPIQAALLSAPLLDRPLTSWRGLACTSDAKMLQVEAGLRYALEHGGTLSVPGFNSATLSPKLAASWGNEQVVLEIRSRRASYIDGVSDNPGEYEVLHPHGCTYRVVAMHQAVAYPANMGQTAKRRTYVLEEIDETSVPPIAPPVGKKAAFAGDWDEARVHRGEHGRFGPGGATSGPTVDLSAVDGIDANPLFRPPGDAPRPNCDAYDLPTPVRSAVSAWLSSLDDARKSAVAAYTTADYADINAPLRRPGSFAAVSLSASAARRIADIQDALLSAPLLDRPLTSWRGLECATPAKLAAIETGLRHAAETGESLVLPGFSSATLCPRKAAAWGDKEVVL